MLSLFRKPAGVYDSKETREQAAQGGHRRLIGGLWEEMGSLQAEFLKARGLRPHHRFIDIGCGSFRAGVKLIPYLDAGNYYGIDPVAELLDAGYANEIEASGLAARFPRDHARVSGRFDISGFGCSFDFGIAQSVFTHLPIKRLTECLSAIAPFFVKGGTFFATVFLVAEGTREFIHSPGGIVTYPDRNPYHTTLGALEQAGKHPGWKMTVIGEWNHPRNQQMVQFVRV